MLKKITFQLSTRAELKQRNTKVRCKIASITKAFLIIFISHRYIQINRLEAIG